MLNLRFQPNNVRHTLPLIANLRANLTDRINEVNAQHPLVNTELDLSCEVVNMSDQGREDLAIAALTLGAYRVNDMLGKVGVEAGGRLRGHRDGVVIGLIKAIKEDRLTTKYSEEGGDSRTDMKWRSSRCSCPPI